MSDEIATTTINAVNTTSDGRVNITVEKYNELLEKVAEQKGSIGSLRERLNKALNEPPVINRTVVEKTVEMVAADHRVWGGSFMGLGTVFFVIGALRYKAGRV